MPATNRRSRRVFLFAGLCCALAAPAPDSWGQEAGAGARATTFVATPGPGGASGSGPSTPSATTPTRGGRPRRRLRAAGRLQPGHAVEPGWPRSTNGAPETPSAVGLRPGVVWSDGTAFSGKDVALLSTYAALLRARPPGGVGIPRRGEGGGRVERRFAFKHAYTPAFWRSAPSPSSPSTGGRGWPTRDIRGPEPGGHRTLRGGASLRAQRLRAGPESGYWQKDKLGVGRCGSRSFAGTRRA